MTIARDKIRLQARSETPHRTQARLKNHFSKNRRQSEPVKDYRRRRREKSQSRRRAHGGRDPRSVSFISEAEYSVSPTPKKPVKNKKRSQSSTRSQAARTALAELQKQNERSERKKLRAIKKAEKLKKALAQTIKLEPSAAPAAASLTSVASNQNAYMNLNGCSHDFLHTFNFSSPIVVRVPYSNEPRDFIYTIVARVLNSHDPHDFLQLIAARFWCPIVVCVQYSNDLHAFPYTIVVRVPHSHDPHDFLSAIVVRVMNSNDSHEYWQSIVVRVMNSHDPHDFLHIVGTRVTNPREPRVFTFRTVRDTSNRNGQEDFQYMCFSAFRYMGFSASPRLNWNLIGRSFRTAVNAPNSIDRHIIRHIRFSALSNLSLTLYPPRPQPLTMLRSTPPYPTTPPCNRLSFNTWISKIGPDRQRSCGTPPQTLKSFTDNPVLSDVWTHATHTI